MTTLPPDHSYSAAHPPESSNGSVSGPAGAQQPGHKRVYQACIPCRRRKVKCDLGSVDNPSDPPCVRCRRESKDCYFSATRRKRKAPEDGGSGSDVDQDYVTRNGRKRLQSSDSGSEPPPSFRQQPAARPTSAAFGHDTLYPPPPGPLTPGGHLGRTQPLRRPNQSPESVHREQRNLDDPNTQYENPEAQTTLRREVYGPHDALELLYKAATNNPDHKRVKSDSAHQSPLNGSISPYIQNQVTSGGQVHGQRRQMPPPDPRGDAKIDPALASASADGEDVRTQDPGYKEALKAWGRFRFVRAGWFTPVEAVAYIDYYYEFLSPLTPISPPTFQNPSSHPTLLMEEPILTVTLLTIASRYRQMPGPGGHCRSHAIHEQLWTYLRGMIERCLWGQEAFGGGFCGSGATEFDQTSSTAPWRGLRKGSLRTLGTIESLMILTEWHPRALHFPPAEATDELMLPSYDQPDNYSTDEDGNHRLAGGVGGKRIESWLEPAWRSDRMCWMLLSNAMGLSYELGVFDRIDELKSPTGDLARPEYEEEAYRLRAARIKKLVLIYVSQLAGRLGWTNMVPSEHIETDLSFSHRRRKSVDLGNTPGTNTTISNGFNYIPDLDLDDQIIHCWAGIANAMRIGNERLFNTRKHTTDIIQSGRYVEELKEFQPILSKWQETFSKCNLPQYIRHILTIEYEYVRIYVNSLSLQAVVERSTNNAGPGNGSGGGLSELSPETQNRYGMQPLARLGGFGPADQEYIKEVVQGSRNLLRTVVDGLLPNGYLKHAPVRTYFRIISGAMFLLKTFALGASKRDVGISLNLMDQVVDALRNCVVDDVHLGIRFADLLETLTSRLRSRFIQGPQGPSNGNSNLVSGAQSPQLRQDAASTSEGRNVPPPWSASTPNFQDSNIPDLNTGMPATPFDMTQSGFFPNVGTPYSSGPSNNLYDMSDPAFGGNEWGVNTNSDMWYLPTGAAFFQNSDQAITQTAEGVQVAGLDLLDYMMGDLPGMDGAGTGAGF